MKIRTLGCFFVAVFMLLCVNQAHADDLNKNIFVSNAWVQAMPPSQKITAAYMVIANNSTKQAVLMSASSPMADATEIHQMSQINGMMNMNMVSHVRIPALGKVELKQGGYHLMLINLKKPVNKGDMVEITLHFQDGSHIMVKAVVKMQAADDSAAMSGMKM
jgi:copper(I)-binding protein